MNRKSLGAVVATALLIVVSVLAVIGFQTWFQTYSSSIFTSAEHNNILSVNFEKEVGDTLYLKSNKISSFDYLSVSSMNGTKTCEISKDSINNLNSNTVLLLDMDHKNSTHIFDLSGYGNNAYIHGANCSENSIYNSGCFFDGINDDLQIPFSSSLNVSQLTVIAWAKTINNNKPTQYILTKNRNDDVALCYHRDYHISFESDDVFARICKADTNLITSRIRDIVKNNTWHFISLVYDGNKQELFFDGILKDTDFNSYGINYDNYDITIGSRDGWITYFNGFIDEVAIYSKPLTEAEISYLYSKKKAIKYEQLISKGISSIDLTSCNLNKGEQYNLIILGDDINIQQNFIAK